MTDDDLDRLDRGQQYAPQHVALFSGARFKLKSGEISWITEAREWMPRLIAGCQEAHKLAAELAAARKLIDLSTPGSPHPIYTTGELFDTATRTLAELEALRTAAQPIANYARKVDSLTFGYSLAPDDYLPNVHTTWTPRMEQWRTLAVLLPAEPEDAK